MKMDLKYFWKVWLLVTSMMLVNASLVTGQTRSNPFEIKPRLKAMNITDTFTPVKIQEDTLIADNKIGKEALDTLSTAKHENKDDINPFDVDHIPVKKSAITKRVENLKAQTDGTQASNGFLFWFILFSSAVLALVLNSKAKTVDLVTKSLFNENILKLFYRDESTGYSSFLYMLYLVFIVNISVFIYLALTAYGMERGILLYLITLVSCILAYGFKHLGLRFLGNVFLIQKNTDLYNFTIMIFNHFVGLILIPINLLMAFGPSGVSKITFWIAVVILGLLLIIRYIRGIFIVSEHITDRLFQIIIYLCGFEVIPVLVLIKTVSKFT
jgi:hypothetical protein